MRPFPQAFSRLAAAASLLAAFSLQAASARLDGSQARQGVNLLPNGGFELGLGAEPFYPGWRAPYGEDGAAVVPLPREVPPKPGVDDSCAHSGKRSLKYSAIPGGGGAVLAFRSPVFPAGSDCVFSIWAKASRPGVKLGFGLCSKPGSFRPSTQLELSSEWRRLEVPLQKLEGFAQIRLETYSQGSEPFDLWLDDACWTLGPHSKPLRAGPVDAVLLPARSNGVHFAGKPLTLRWSADAEKPCEAVLKLYLTDLVRGGEAEQAWSGKASLSTSPSSATMELQGVKRGAYLAELQFLDPSSGALLASAKERFTVLTDLRELPPPFDFDVGMHYGLGFGKDRYFNWRGYWSPDEFFANCFQTGFRVQRHIWKWESLEPERGRYAWESSAFERLVDAALRNGCKSFPCIPGHPFNVERAEYKKLLASPQAADGSWIVRQGSDISSSSVRSNPMGFSQDPLQRRMLVAPPPGSLAGFMEAFAARYKDKIVAIELTNEPNLYLKPDALLEHYFKEAYPAVKKVAPALPVLMNQTMDFNADGNGYTGQFFKLGAFSFCDGFTHHPYGKSSLAQDGLNGVKALASIAGKFSTPERKMVLGMSECHFIGQPFTRGQAVQRALLDWSIGCKWSAGFIIDGSFFLEAGPWNMFFNRSACAPGVGSAELNGFYAALGGCKALNRIELDDNVLILALEKASSAPGKPWAAALTCAELPLKHPLLEVDFSGLDVEAFDCCAEPFALEPGKPLRLGPETIYLKSSSKELFARLQAAKPVWVQEIGAVIECPEGQKDPETNEALLATGLPPRRLVSCGLLGSWTQLKAPSGADPKASPFDLGLLGPDGRLASDAIKLKELDASGEPYVFVDASGKAAESRFAFMSIESDAGREQEFSFSSCGPAELWLNGKLAFSTEGQGQRILGAERKSFKLPVAKGVNSLLLRLKGSPCAFRLVAGSEPEREAIDEDGYFRNWLFIGPWENKRDASGKFVGCSTKFLPETLLDVAPKAGDFASGGFAKRKLPLIWSLLSSPSAKVSHPWQEAVSYAYAAFASPEELDCFVSFGADDGYALWLNGVELGREGGVSRGAKPDDVKIPVKLKKGRNAILFKLEDTGGGGALILRFVDASGKPVPLKGLPLE